MNVWATRAAVLILPQIAVTVLGLVNARADPELQFSVVYLLPVLAAAYWGGRVPGILAALTATAVWSFNSEYGPERTSTLVAAAWNVFSRLAIYVVVVLAVDRFVGAHREVSRLAVSDALTGVANARALHARLAEEVRRSERTGRTFALLAIDGDHLKAINDRFGHAAGDRLIVALAEILGEQRRGSDLVARVGGDEFVVVLAECDAGSAAAAAERIRGRAREAEFRLAGQAAASVTVSIGVTVSDGQADVAELLQRADAALYAAKAAGRDRVVDWASLARPS